MRRLLSVLVLLVLVLTGCTAGGGDSGGALDAATGSDDGGAGGSAAGGESGGESGGDLSVDEAVQDEDRQVVTEGSVTMTVPHPRSAAQDAARLVEHVGGHVAERSEHAGSSDDDATAELVVRVPAAELTGVLEQLEQLGTVESVQLTSTDVTAQSQDLDARIRALQISVGRLEALLAGAQSTSDLVAAESTLTERQSQLESLLSQRARLLDQVQMSTVRLSFWTEGTVPPPAASGFFGGLSAGWQALVATLSGALLVLGVLVPWALAAGVLVLLVVAVRRSFDRRQAATALPAAPTEGGDHADR